MTAMMPPTGGQMDPAMLAAALAPAGGAPGGLPQPSMGGAPAGAPDPMSGPMDPAGGPYGPDPAMGGMGGQGDESQEPEFPTTDASFMAQALAQIMQMQQMDQQHLVEAQHQALIGNPIFAGLTQGPMPGAGMDGQAMTGGPGPLDDPSAGISPMGSGGLAPTMA